MRMPKGIIDHPAVQECENEDDIPDYRYCVFLKEGWLFKNGRMANCRGGNFNTVADFKYAKPTVYKP